jgi:hypothetical protein
MWGCHICDLKHHLLLSRQMKVNQRSALITVKGSITAPVDSLNGCAPVLLSTTLENADAEEVPITFIGCA